MSAIRSLPGRKRTSLRQPISVAIDPQETSATLPSEIPIYQASRFFTIVNLTTAKTQGITIPASLLARADEVIE